MSTESRKFHDLQSVSVHGPIVPADVREGDPIQARLLSSALGGLGFVDLPVWRMSPLGIELVNSSSITLPRGAPVDLEVKVGNQRSTLSGLVVDEVSFEKSQKILHIRLTPRLRERVESQERRGATRWICSEDFFPTGIASNPAKFNDFVYFKVKDISAGGLKLHTSLRNKFIIPGMIFDAIVNFPMVAQVKMRLEVRSVRVELVQGKDVLALGVVFSINDRFVSGAVSQYLTQFGALGSLEEARQHGLHPEHVAQAVNYSYVRTKEDYEEVLQLRHRAYLEAGKITADTKPEDMADEYDARARIVIGRYNGKVVASARLIFNQFEDRMEQEAFVKWPDRLPRRDEMVEVTRACTLPEFRRSDLLMSMLKFVALTVAQSKRKWIIICATDHMAVLYKKLGFEEVGLSYPHSKLNGLVHHVMVANVPDAMLGKTVGMVTWNVVWAEVSTFMENYGLIQLDPMSSIRLGLYRILGPLSQLIYKVGKLWRARKVYPSKTKSIFAVTKQELSPSS